MEKTIYVFVDWSLPYDLNPVTPAHGLHLNITESDNRLDFDLAMEVIGYFRISAVRAEEVLGEVRQSVGKWREKADAVRIGRAEQARMEQAFNI